MNQLSLFDVPVTPSPMASSRSVDLPPVVPGRPEVVYRLPGNLGLAWTGRGKPPRWVTEWIESGKSLDALRVSTTLRPVLCAERRASTQDANAVAATSSESSQPGN